MESGKFVTYAWLYTADASAFFQGTWQFYSYGLQRNPSKWTHDLRDDLESFLWVTVYMVSHIHRQLPCPL